MNSINRIVFTGDMLRSHAGERNQLSNIYWLQRRFGGLITEISGLETEIRLAGSPPFNDDSNIQNVFASLGQRPGMLSWAKLFSSAPTAEFLQLIERDYVGSLVISIELPPILETALDQMGVPWIDIGISPLRFLPDFAISFRTSVHFENYFNTKLLLDNSCVNESVKTVQNYYNNNIKVDLSNALVFFAQTNQDRTLIENGIFAGVNHALQAIQEKCSGRKIFVKPHPLQPDNPIILACINEFGAKIIEENTYEILSLPQDISIVTLSSSVGPEAKAFGKPTHIACGTVQSAAYSGPSSMVHGRSAQLWTDLISAVMPTNLALGEPWEPNQLRRELGAFGLDPAIYG